ncbi:MAG: hypothetical protein ACSW8H_08490 [bacterium]
MEEELSVFKSYLRNLLRKLNELQKAIESDNKEEALRLIGELCTDTQNGIED